MLMELIVTFRSWRGNLAPADKDAGLKFGENDQITQCHRVSRWQLEIIKAGRAGGRQWRRACRACGTSRPAVHAGLAQDPLVSATGPESFNQTHSEEHLSPCVEG